MPLNQGNSHQRNVSVFVNRNDAGDYSEYGLTDMRSGDFQVDATQSIKVCLHAGRGLIIPDSIHAKARLLDVHMRNACQIFFMPAIYFHETLLIICEC